MSGQKIIDGLEEADQHARVTDQTKQLWLLLHEFYDDGEIAEYLFSPHPQFPGYTAMDLIALGRIDDVIRTLKALDEGAYL